MVNVGKYTIHGWGWYFRFVWHCYLTEKHQTWHVHKFNFFDFLTLCGDCSSCDYESPILNSSIRDPLADSDSCEPDSQLFSTETQTLKHKPCYILLYWWANDGMFYSCFLYKSLYHSVIQQPHRTPTNNPNSLSRHIFIAHTVDGSEIQLTS